MKIRTGALKEKISLFEWEGVPTEGQLDIADVGTKTLVQQRMVALAPLWKEQSQNYLDPQNGHNNGAISKNGKYRPYGTKIMDPRLPILSIVGYWAIILATWEVPVLGVCGKGLQGCGGQAGCYGLHREYTFIAQGSLILVKVDSL